MKFGKGDCHVMLLSFLENCCTKIHNVLSGVSKIVPANFYMFSPHVDNS
jgi:hypothetical protein